MILKREQILNHNKRNKSQEYNENICFPPQEIGKDSKN